MDFKILVAEDEKITLKHLLYTLQQEGYDVQGVPDGQEARKKMENGYYDLLIADIKMPGLTGIQLLDIIKEKRLGTEVIIITGFGSIGSAIEAMKKGAYDYITKPFDLDEIVLKAKNIQKQKILEKENTALKAILGAGKKYFIIAESDSMKRILEVVESIRDSNCHVFLTGESGVGKNLIARIIHSTSQRQDRPFLSINCATLTEELLASELFGYEKGAFTGAINLKQGLLEVADTGTLLLDEIAEMSTVLQAKLLKVIEEGEFFRVGGTKPIHVDVRFIAATNQNVSTFISEGRFREDLYYRLNVMELFISSLRDRKKDLEPLTAYFLQKHLPKYHKKITGFTPEAVKVLKSYSFPGNVRELENIIERAIILEKGPLISPESLPQSIKMFHIETVEPGRVKTLDNLNKDYAEQVLTLVGGNKSKAAELLGISRTSLWRILKEE